MSQNRIRGGTCMKYPCKLYTTCFRLQDVIGTPSSASNLRIAWHLDILTSATFDIIKCEDISGSVYFWDMKFIHPMTSHDNSIMSHKLVKKNGRRKGDWSIPFGSSLSYGINQGVFWNTPRHGNQRKPHYGNLRDINQPPHPLKIKITKSQQNPMTSPLNSHDNPMTNPLYLSRVFFLPRIFFPTFDQPPLATATSPGTRISMFFFSGISRYLRDHCEWVFFVGDYSIIHELILYNYLCLYPYECIWLYMYLSMYISVYVDIYIYMHSWGYIIAP